MRTITVTVTGQSKDGKKVQHNYLTFDEDSYDAIQTAIEWAKDEYNVRRNEDGTIIPNSSYQEFYTITSIEILEENN